jgi:hypothetical protein
MTEDVCNGVVHGREEGFINSVFKSVKVWLKNGPRFSGVGMTRAGRVFVNPIMVVGE